MQNFWVQKNLKKIQRPGSREGPSAAGRHHTIALGMMLRSETIRQHNNASIGFIDTGGIMMNAQEYFERHTEEIISQWAGKNAVLFFRGFVPGNVRWLVQREDSLLPAEQILNDDGTISIARIDAARRKLVQNLMVQGASGWASMKRCWLSSRQYRIPRPCSILSSLW